MIVQDNARKLLHASPHSSPAYSIQMADRFFAFCNHTPVIAAYILDPRHGIGMSEQFYFGFHGCILSAVIFFFQGNGKHHREPPFFVFYRGQRRQRYNYIIRFRSFFYYDAHLHTTVQIPPSGCIGNTSTEYGIVCRIVLCQFCFVKKGGIGTSHLQSHRIACLYKGIFSVRKFEINLRVVHPFIHKKYIILLSAAVPVNVHLCYVSVFRHTEDIAVFGNFPQPRK